MGSRAYTFDSQLELQDSGVGAITASAGGKVGGSNQILDVGGVNPARVEMWTIFDVDALDLSSGDETYRLSVQLSNSSTFASGVIDCGSVNVVQVGRHEVGWTNEQGSTTYRYARCFATLAGTTPSLTYRAWSSELPGR